MFGIGPTFITSQVKHWTQKAIVIGQLILPLAHAKYDVICILITYNSNLIMQATNESS